MTTKTQAKAVDKSQIKNAQLGEFRLFDGIRYTNYVYVKSKA